ncbi:MAG: hypothetical protein IJP80_01835 [Bacteroidales bacterium]|nr:hypothetical protein [Bacteroidales bacterium]
MTKKEILDKIEQLDKAIENYEELDSDMESPEYIARGNGFSDSKFSEAFISTQLERLRQEKAELEEIRKQMRIIKKQKL